jgi:hypothetical protein
MGSFTSIRTCDRESGVLLQYCYSAYKAFSLPPHSSALSLPHYFQHLVLAWVSMGTLDESHWKTYSISNMDVPFHSSGAMSRAHYAIVRKVESASTIQSGDQHIFLEINFIQERLAYPKLQLVCAFFFFLVDCNVDFCCRAIVKNALSYCCIVRCQSARGFLRQMLLLSRFLTP